MCTGDLSLPRRTSLPKNHVSITTHFATRSSDEKILFLLKRRVWSRKKKFTVAVSLLATLLIGAALLGYFLASKSKNAAILLLFLRQVFPQIYFYSILNLHRPQIFVETENDISIKHVIWFSKKATHYIGR